MKTMVTNSEEQNVILTDGDWRLVANPLKGFQKSRPWRTDPYVEHYCGSDTPRYRRWFWFIVFAGFDVDGVERCADCNQAPPDGMLSSMWLLEDPK